MKWSDVAGLLSIVVLAFPFVMFVINDFQREKEWDHLQRNAERTDKEVLRILKELHPEEDDKP